MKILVVDDHPLFRDAIAHLLRELGTSVEVLSAGDTAEALRAVQLHADLAIALIDLNLPGEDGIVALERCRALRPGLPIAVISGSESPADMQRAINSGARGYIPKSAPGEAMVMALREVLAGKTHYTSSVRAHTDEAAASKLTLRQLEVLALLCQGQSNKQIARSLDLAEQTIKVHVTAIFKALNVVNRTQAVLAARRLGVSSG